MNTRNLLVLPDDLPVPENDGACAHLEGMAMPAIALASTSGVKKNLGLESGISIVYFYPMTGRPDAPPMIGWNEIPGARGCTPQSCSFRDCHSELVELGAKVYGVSSQSTEDQKEAVQRLHLPFELLSDSNFELTTALKLPTFEYNSLRLIKRLTLIIENGAIRKVFYPVFPPNENAANVIAWFHQAKA
ncbi:MAG: peroxiredoxin [Thiobacillus sp.]|nr:peroxiredoxin [Thiobacillus sp.]TXH76948.1 MAG: peroxiredoxin [Thiobacillus sp.]